MVRMTLAVGANQRATCSKIRMIRTWGHRSARLSAGGVRLAIQYGAPPVRPQVRLTTGSTSKMRWIRSAASGGTK